MAMGHVLRRMLWIVLLTGSLATACSSAAIEQDEGPAANASVSVPAVDSVIAPDLQARAITRACRSGCLLAESTPDLLKDALAQHTDQVEYLSKAEIEEFSADDGGLASSSLIMVSGVQATERRDVRSVDVSISRGLYDFARQTYLFRWDGSAWVNTSPDAVGVTVTSAVS